MNKIFKVFGMSLILPEPVIFILKLLYITSSHKHHQKF